MREVITPNRSFETQAQNFQGARGIGDQEKALEKVQRVQQIEDPLHGDTDVWEVLKHEKPVHRRMIEMSIQGYTPKEIAEATRYNEHHVRKVLRQPWARERMIQAVKKTVSEEIKDFLEAEVLPSLRTLKAVRDGDAVNPMTRVTASNSILDRFLGKPTQPITTGVKPPSELSDAELREQIQREITTQQPN